MNLWNKLFGKEKKETTSDDQTPLMQAASKGDLDRVKALIAAGADVNAKTKDGKCVLTLAALGMNADCVKCLIAAGADVNAKDNSGWTPLLSEIVLGNVESIKALLLAGADINVVGGHVEGITLTPLTLATDRSEIVAILRAAGATK